MYSPLRLVFTVLCIAYSPRHASSYSTYDGAQGPDSRLWPIDVQKIHEVVREVAHATNDPYNHASVNRIALSMERIMQYAQQRSRFLFIGEHGNGILPSIISLLLDPSWIQVTTWDAPSGRHKVIPNLANGMSTKEGVKLNFTRHVQGGFHSEFAITHSNIHYLSMTWNKNRYHYRPPPLTMLLCSMFLNI